jgi:hypothetical protein
MKSLGEELRDALTNITSLIMKTDSSSKRRTLTKQQAEIAGKLQVFVDGVVNAELPEYEAATNALQRANAMAIAAKRNLDKVAETIREFAGAIDKLGELVDIVS